MVSAIYFLIRHYFTEIMKTVKKSIGKLPVVISCILLSLFLVACSDDEKAVVKLYDHNHSGNTNMGKHRFEHNFAEQCIAREIENSINKNNDRERFAEPCLCIANYLLQDLSETDAEKFINENKHTRSLQIKYDSAAYYCLQEKQPPQAPKIFQSR